MQSKGYFTRSSAKRVQQKTKSAEDSLFVQPEKPKYELTETRKEDQKAVDLQVLKAIKRSPKAKLLMAYLKSQFSLSRNDKPHKMIF